MSKYYTDEFKQNIVALRRSGKETKEIVSEYKITKSSLHMWEKQFTNSGKFTVIDNLNDSEKELRELRKTNKRLLMEVDILKQVTHHVKFSECAGKAILQITTIF